MIGVGAVADERGILERRHAAALFDMHGVASGGYGCIGDGEEVDAATGELGVVILVDAVERVEGEAVLLGVGADKTHTGHVGELHETHADIHAVEAFGGLAGGVDDGEFLAVHLPGEEVGIGVVLEDGEMGDAHARTRLDVGTAGIVVDGRLDVGGGEGYVLVARGAEGEGADLGVHLTRGESEMVGGEGALVDGGGAGSRSALRHQRHMAAQRGFAAVHNEGATLVERRHRHGVGIGEPVEVSFAVADIGEALFLADGEGVGDCHCRVGKEEEVLGGGAGGEVVEAAAAAETVVVKANLLAVGALATVGGVAARGGFGAEAEVVVLLHTQGLDDVGEDARRGEDAVELEAVGDEVGHAVDGEGVEDVEEAVAGVLAVLDFGTVVEDVAVLEAVEDGIFLVLGEARMVVGAVDLEGTDEVAQGGADKLLVLGGLVEVGDVELEVVDLGHVEAEGLVVEVAVGDGEDELANMDAAGEMERTVATDGDLVAGEAVGVDDDHLAVGDDEGVDAADDEVVVGEVEACVGTVGGGLEVEGVVVVALVA